ncbi:COG4828 Predicted membrane protein [Mycobacteriaceae bacterium]
MSFYEVIETVGKTIDAVGVAVIAVGALISAAGVISRLRTKTGDVYRVFRQQLGRSILLGLEFLVAADIIRTVAVTPDARSVAVLAGIVLIRTFLSFSLELEVTGYWPWQKNRQQQQAAPQSGP